MPRRGVSRSLPLPVRLLVRLCVRRDRRADVLGDLEEVQRERSIRGRRVGAWLATCVEGCGIAIGLAAERVWSRTRGRGRVASARDANVSPARSARWFSLLELRLALRLVGRQPLLSAASVLALATAIGLATSGLTLLSQALWGHLPVPGGERFVSIETTLVPEGRRSGLTPDRFGALAKETGVLEAFGAWRNVSTNLVVRAGDEPVPVRVTELTPVSFEHVPYATKFGRPLLPSDSGRAASHVLVLGEDLWRSRFGGDGEVIGAVVSIGGEAYEVVGVAPSTWSFPHRADAWTPLDVGGFGPSWAGNRPGFHMYGVLGPGISTESARARLQAITSAVPSLDDEESELRVAVAPFTRPREAGIGLFMGGVVVALVLVLVVVSGNVANLVLARTVARAGELSVRTSLGASRARLIGQIAVEVLLLGIAAAVLGLAGSAIALDRLRAAVPELPWWITLRPDLTIVAFVVALLLLVTAIAGVAPAVRATRDSALAAASRGATDPVRFGRVSTTMIVLQLAVSTAFLAGAAVMMRALLAYSARDYGMSRDDVLTASVYFEPPLAGAVPAGAIDGDAMARTFDSIVRELSDVPGIVSIGVSSDLPRTQSRSIVLELEEAIPGATPAVVVSTSSVTPGFFEAIGVAPLDGRTFSNADLRETRGVVVNQPFVDMHLGGRRAVGRRLRLRSDGTSPDSWREIIGVVPDLGMSPGDASMAPGVYFPLGATNRFHVAARAQGSPSELIGPIRRAIAVVDPAIRVEDVMLLEKAGWENRALLRGTGFSLAAMGVMALALSIISTYALMSFSVSRRRREIGIRRALGGGDARILRAILNRSVRQLAIGAAAGVILAFGVLRLTALVPFPVARPAWVIPAVVAILIFAGLTACLIPARAALAVRPADALRVE